jgi:hypothetical protein
MKRSWFSVSCVMVLVLASAAVAAAAGVPVAPGGATSDKFEPSSGCGCHATFVEQWNRSMHAQALTDPLYLTKLEEAKKATDGKLGAFCNKCHGPIATLSREIDGKMSAVSGEGITCSFCHQVVGLKGQPANTSHLVAADGVRRAQLKDPQAPHPAAYSAFHEKAEFCGGCHNVLHPINGMHLEATYDEWKASPYAKEGVVCQNCHMGAEAGRDAPDSGQACGGGPQRDNIFHMTFVGGQVALGPSAEAIARLQSAAMVEMDVAEIVAPGETASMTVTVTNTGAGHYLPTGLTEIRQMWLEVYAEDAEGQKTEIGERRFGTILKDAKGNSPVELWDAVAIESDDRIPPRESIEETYEFAMPEGADRATVTAVLRYKSAPDEFAEKAGVENPTTDMAAATQQVFASAEAKAGAVEEQSPEQTSSGWWNIAVVLVGFAAIIGVVGFFIVRGRKAA